jgi:hypothetical protein
MSDNTLTLVNLERILFAMNQIKEIDRSDYFKRYHFEVVLRIDQINALNKLEQDERNKQIADMARRKQALQWFNQELQKAEKLTNAE